MRNRRWLIVAALAAGCGGPPPGPPPVPVTPVSGSVTVNGQPHPNVRVRFVADDPSAAVAEAEALTAADGMFQLTTYQPGDGLPPGRYAVFITWPEAVTDDPTTSGDHLRGRYNNPKRPAASATVTDKPFQLPPLALTR